MLKKKKNKETHQGNTHEISTVQIILISHYMGQQYIKKENEAMAATESWILFICFLNLVVTSTH